MMTVHTESRIIAHRRSSISCFIFERVATAVSLMFSLNALPNVGNSSIAVSSIKVGSCLSFCRLADLR